MTGFSLQRETSPGGFSGVAIFVAPKAERQDKPLARAHAAGDPNGNIFVSAEQE